MIEQDLNVDAEFQELLAKYTAATFLDKSLCYVDIEPRAVLIDPWMKEGDLGFLYGARGSGKTWVVNLLCQHLGKGEELEGWKIPAPASIIYIDGEMPAEDSRARIEGLGVTGKVWLLNHELLWQKSEIVMNLTEPKIQEIITALCIQKEAKLLVLDNLSCLFQGIKENDNDEWEKVLNWLLDLRRRKIAVLIVHHSGRSGNGMRGASRREDAAFWIIKVEKIETDGGDVGRTLERSSKNKEAKNVSGIRNGMSRRTTKERLNSSVNKLEWKVGFLIWLPTALTPPETLPKSWVALPAGFREKRRN